MTPEPSNEGAPDRLLSVWASRDFPVLLEVARRLDGGTDWVRTTEVAEAAGLTNEEVVLAANALRRRRLVETMDTSGGPVGFTDISAEAYFLTGLHPSGDDAVSRLVAALREAAEQVDDPAEKSKLRALADQALGVGRDVLGGVLVAVATQGLS